MAITFPLTPPATIAKGITFTPVTVVAESTSPFTLEQEIFEHQGQMWKAAVRLPPMAQDEAEDWVSFGLALNGRAGTFLFGDPSGQTARGTVAGVPLVDGADQQRSKVLNTKGWTPSSAIFQAGDYIQLPNNRLHKVLTDISADGSGLAALDIFPRVRDVLSDGATIIVANTAGIWRIDGDVPPWSIDEAIHYGISFTAREAI